MEKDLRSPIEYTEWVQEGSNFSPVDRQIPVVPVFDKDIASLPHSERVEKIRESRMAYATPFLKEIFEIPLEQVRPETLELASVIYDISSRDWEVEHYSKLREVDRQKYEEEKKAIREGKRGAKARNKKVELASKQYRQKDSELESRVESAKILKDTTLDDFIKSTFLTPGGAEAFLLSAQDLQEQSYIENSAATDLLREAQERLRTTIESEAIGFFRYKDSFGNLTTAEQAKPLSQILDLAFKNNGQSEIESQLQITARDLLEFYWKNFREIASVNDETPLFGQIHDLLLASNIGERRDVLIKTIEFLDVKIGEDFVKLTNEYTKMARLHFREHYALIEELINDKNQANFNGSLIDFLTNDSEYIQKWNPENRGSISAGPYSDRSMSLDSFGLLCRSYGLRNVLPILEQGWKRTPGEQKLIDYYYDLFQRFDNNVMAAFPDHIKLSQVLAYRLNKSDYINGLRTIANNTVPSSAGRVRALPNSLSTREDRESFLEHALKRTRRNLDFHPEAYKEKVLTRFALQAMFYDSLEDDRPEALLNLSTENIALSHKINNENLWFVAEQGDQFSAKRNQDLEKFDVKSITFYPNPDYSGHLIDIDSDLRDPEGRRVSLRVIVTRSGELLNPNGHKLEIPDWTQLPFKNLILRRLHFITSGALGNREPHPKVGVEEVETPTEARRSHWRVLTSQNGRVYTLNSPEAKEHAEYVKETYGIDIYEENLRRKQAGTLGSNQVITFVKSVTGKKEPNQLVYDEEKLKEFEATLPNLA